MPYANAPRRRGVPRDAELLPGMQHVASGIGRGGDSCDKPTCMTQLTPQILGFLGGLLAGGFGAGVSFQVWVSDRPTKVEMTAALSPLAEDARAARAEAFGVRQDIRQLRQDLAGFAGRALARRPQDREAAAGKAARLYRQEVARGVSPDEAMARVLESDWP